MAVVKISTSVKAEFNLSPNIVVQFLDDASLIDSLGLGGSGVVMCRRTLACRTTRTTSNPASLTAVVSALPIHRY